MVAEIEDGTSKREIVNITCELMKCEYYVGSYAQKIVSTGNITYIYARLNGDLVS
jgi:hypothetical protein